MIPRNGRGNSVAAITDPSADAFSSHVTHVAQIDVPRWALHLEDGRCRVTYHGNDERLGAAQLGPFTQYIWKAAARFAAR